MADLDRDNSVDGAAPSLSRNYEFVADVSKYSCPVCFELMFDPQLLGCCGHHICDQCLKKMQSSNMAGLRRCPLCQSDSFTTMLNKGMAREVRSVHVYCPNSSEGCDWVNEIMCVEEHLSRACQFQRVLCPNEGCGEEILRCDLASHQSEICRFRLVECEFCNDYKSTFEDVTMNHYPHCPAHPVDCPNKCGERNLPRAKLDEHLERCPLQMIDCDFKSVGCGFRRKREAMNGHLEVNSIFHMKLLCRTVANDRSDFEKKMTSLQNEIASLREENERKSQKISEVKDLNERLTSDVDQLKKEVEEVGSLKKQVEELSKQLQAIVLERKEEKNEQNQGAEMQDQLASQIIKMQEEADKTKSEIKEKLKVLDDKASSQEKSVKELESEMKSQKEAVTVIQETEHELSEAQITSLKETIGKDIDERVDKVSGDVDKKLKESSDKLEEKLTAATEKLDTEVAARNEAMEKVKQDLVYVEKSLTPHPPYAFTVSRFQERKSHKEAFVSAPFYHDLRGYKMCVRVDVYGLNNHVAVFCCIMRGEHDEKLEWPFFGAIKIRLQNHLEDRNHFEKDIRFERTTDEKKSGRVKTGDKNYLHGHPQFIAHTKLAFDAEKNCQYLKGDALDFEVVHVELLPRRP